MFDFENLIVYKKAKLFSGNVNNLLKDNKRIDPAIRNQLRRASLSIPVNIAEGTGRFTKADKKNFYVIARGSTYECVALLDIMKDEQVLDEDVYKALYNKLEELSKMLYALIHSRLKKT